MLLCEPLYDSLSRFVIVTGEIMKRKVGDLNNILSQVLSIEIVID